MVPGNGELGQRVSRGGTYLCSDVCLGKLVEMRRRGADWSWGAGQERAGGSSNLSTESLGRWAVIPEILRKLSK